MGADYQHALQARIDAIRKIIGRYWGHEDSSFTESKKEELKVELEDITHAPINHYDQISPEIDAENYPEFVIDALKEVFSEE